MLALSYTELIPVLIKAVQEQQQLIENLTKQVASTEAENVELRKVKNQYEALSVKIQHIEDLMQRSNRTPAVTASNK
jgi:Tfp pilus assembly protein PilN